MMRRKKRGGKGRRLVTAAAVVALSLLMGWLLGQAANRAFPARNAVQSDVQPLNLRKRLI